MAVLPLKTYDASVLRADMRSVDELTDEVLSLVDDMKESMYAHNGVGLAAPQVGQPLQITVMDCSEDRDGSEQICMINPEIIETSGELEGTEGCLSLPGIWGDPHRHQYAKAKYLSEEGEIETIERAGLWARCIQHEVDHLNGSLFIDHLTGEDRERAEQRFDSLNSWEEDPSSRLDRAETWETYVDRDDRFAEFNRTRYEKLLIPPSHESFFESLDRQLQFAVLVERSNYEAAMIVPILARLADVSDAIRLRLFPSDEHADLRDYYRTYGKHRTPVLILFDASCRELGVWGPRPDAADRLLEKLDLSDVPDSERVERLEQYYNERGVTDVLDELRDLLS